MDGRISISKGIRFLVYRKLTRVYSVQEPGQLMYPGIHNVRYIASDAAGNRAECHFSIHVRGKFMQCMERLHVVVWPPDRWYRETTSMEYFWEIAKHWICPSQSSHCVLMYIRMVHISLKRLLRHPGPTSTENPFLKICNTRPSSM